MTGPLPESPQVLCYVGLRAVRASLQRQQELVDQYGPKVAVHPIDCVVRLQHVERELIGFQFDLDDVKLVGGRPVFDARNRARDHVREAARYIGHAVRGASMHANGKAPRMYEPDVLKGLCVDAVAELGAGIDELTTAIDRLGITTRDPTDNQVNGG